MTFERLAFSLAVLALFPADSRAQPAPAPVAAPTQSYADLADLATVAPLAIDAQIRSAIRLKDPAPAGKARFYVEAQVRSLIRGPATPALVNYVAEVPLDSRGRAPKLKKKRVLLLARPVPGKPASVQLVAPGAQLAWTAAEDARLRAVLTEITAPGAAPRITGVNSAFHVPGAIPGEGETQIFLQTETGEPVSISVLRRPGQIARWAVALGEIVDEAAEPPRPGTLLWYRLACFLPRTLPESAIDPGDPANAAKAREDYRLVIDGLGPCDRS